MIYLSGGTDAFRQTLLIELYPKKAGLMSAKRGEKAMKTQSPCGFPQGFRCLHVHYTLSHIENQPAAKKFMFTMFDEKARISDIFLGFCSYIFRFSAKQRHVENSVHSHAKKLLQFVHIPGFRNRLHLHAFCGKHRSFIKRAALPPFQGTPTTGFPTLKTSSGRFKLPS